ncbi:hypothetical protein BJV82DRAFT_597714 [Fennellomyces sp. T-0311]|nr:hypothetical protein BJV82DRAFT_597714 [Fennellomyces sp. T-0311]
MQCRGRIEDIEQQRLSSISAETRPTLRYCHHSSIAITKLRLCFADLPVFARVEKTTTMSRT